MLKLWQDPQYRMLSPGAQMEVASRYVWPELEADPRFRTLSFEAKELVRRRYAIEAVTFDTAMGMGDQMKSVMMDRLTDRSIGTDIAKIATVGAFSVVQNSGLASFLTSLLEPDEAASARRRTLDFVQAAAKLTGDSNDAETVGALVGNLADIFAVNAIMGPATTAARTAVSTAARGGAEVVARAGSLAKAPLLKPALEILGGVAAESAIEAVPYFLIEEQRRRANGEEGVLAQGPLEVARVLGVNAAADFAVGSILQAGLLKGAKMLFGPNDVYEAAFKNEAEYRKLRSQIRTGRTSPEVFARYTPIQQDAYRQRQAIDDYLVRGVADPVAEEWTKDALLAHDLGRIIGRADDGSYRIWRYDKTGAPVMKAYSNIVDAENSLSFEAYTAWAKLPVEARDSFLGPHTNWSIARGQILAQQQSLVGSSSHTTADPVLAAMRKQDSKLVKPIDKRVVVTQGEAASLSKLTNGDTHVILAKIPLKGSIVEGANLGDVNLMRGSASVRVASSDAPNAVFIGVKNATTKDWDSATTIAQRIIKNDPSITLEQARASTLLNNGFDHMAFPDGTVEFFAPRNMKLIGSIEDVTGKRITPTVAGQASAVATVTREVPQFIGAAKIGKRPDAVIAGAIHVLRSNGDGAADFAKLYLSASDTPLDDNLVVTVKKLKSLSNPQVRKGPNGIEIRLPSEEIRTPAQERRYVAALLNGLDEVKAPGTVANKGTEYWASKFVSQKQVFDVPYGVNTAGWLRDVAKPYGGSLTKVADGYSLRMPSGAEVVGSPEHLMTWFTRQVADELVVTRDLASQGITLRRLPTGYRATSTQTRKLITTADTLPKILENLDYIPQKLDSSFGPRVLAITPEGLKMQLAGTKTFKDREEAFKFLSKFVDSKRIGYERAIASFPEGTLSVTGTGGYRVHLPGYDADRIVESMAEARDLLRRSDDLDFEELRDIAQSKHADITIRNGKYVVMVGPNRYPADDLEGLKKVFRERIPQFEDGTPNILDDLDPTLEGSVSDIVNRFKGAHVRPRVGPNPYNLPPEIPFDPARDLSQTTVWESARQHTANFTSWLEGYTKRTNNKVLAEAAARFREGMRESSLNTVADNRTLDTIFRGQNGKLLSRQQRVKLFYHLGATSEEEMDIFRAQHAARYGKTLAPLTQEETAVAAKIKTYLEDISYRFGIRYQDLIGRYMPHLRDMYDSTNIDLLKKMQTADELVASLDPTLPKDLKFWAENARVDDVVQYFLKDDALEVLMMYSAQGNKKLYLNNAWRGLAEAVKATNVDETVARRIEIYRENVMSYSHTHAERMVEDVCSKALRSLKKIPVIGDAIPMSERDLEAVGRNAFKSMMSMSYFASMGWKPFLAIRNAMQPLTMTAPRIGLNWVTQAYKEVLDDPSDIARRLRKMGVLTEKPPIVNQVFGHETTVGRTLEKSMQWFKNSDDLTRMVAYRAGELKFDNAVRAWDLGQIRTQKTFFEMSGLDVMDPDTARRTWELFSTAGEDTLKRNSARDLFAFKLQRDTMFDYSGTDTPAMMQTGITGKLFGQYGTYSAAYRANMANMLRYGSFAKRAEMVTTYLGITSALWAGFAALRVKTNDFIPGAGAIFTGGPLFDVAIDVVRSMDPGYEGEQARARLKVALPRMLPGSAQYLAVKRAMEYQEQGDTYGALLSLAATPVEPAW